jgi:hypothetical protein
MTKRPTFDLSRLREIAWAKWDPIGVGRLEEGWTADEYDIYLLNAAGQLWNGHSDDEVAAYLVKAETEDMGLAAAPGIRSRARDVAQAIRSYIETLRH